MTIEKPDLKNFSDTELQAELLRRSKCQFGRPSCAGYGEYWLVKRLNLTEIQRNHICASCWLDIMKHKNKKPC